MYGPVAALREVNFAVEGGHVHALLGENGCGKSTLIKIMTGAQRPTSGTLLIDGNEIQLSRPSSAQGRGIAVVHQNYHLFPDMSVLENIVAGNAHVPRSKVLLGGVSRKRQEEIVRGLLEQLNIELNLGSQAALLDPAERKFVEVARAMMRSPQFLFLDEPTASLEPQSARRVLDLVRVLADQGVGVAFVSHRLDEVVSVCDRFTVLRDAREVAHGPIREVSEADLVRLMVGDLHEMTRASQARQEPSEVAIQIRACATGPGKRAFDLDVPRGQVMALTGLVGSGASDVVQMLGGSKPFRGSLSVSGVSRRINHPRDALRYGIGYAPEDRKGAGLVIDHAIDINVSYASLDRVSKFGVVAWRRVAAIAEEYRQKLSIRTPSVHSPVSSLSGGNQQKVMLAKLFNSGVATLVLEEPTQGVDVRGRSQIHVLLREFADAGGTVIVASTDVREVASISDHVAVFRHGELAEVLDSASIREGDADSSLQEYLVGVMESGVSDTSHGLVHPDDAQVARLEREEAGK
jgi:ABC-type sugar transport system ATPase subunit